MKFDIELFRNSTTNFNNFIKTNEKNIDNEMKIKMTKYIEAKINSKKNEILFIVNDFINENILRIH